MSENKDESLIGYDPLAWLNQIPADEVVAEPAEMEMDSAEVTPCPAEETALSPSVPTSISSLAPTEDNPRESSESAFQYTITLESVLNIRDVVQLHKQLLDALNNYQQIDIDASAVSIADTSSLQLLLIFKISALKVDKLVNIDFPSEKFIEACNLLGISEILDLDQAAFGLF